MSPGARWIAGVIATLVGGVIAMVALIIMAERANAGRIVPNYYQRAAHFDDDIAAADASRALGWTATTTLSADAVRVCLVDRAGRPVAATTTAVVTHRAFPGQGQTATLTAGADGCAAAPLALRRGVHDVTLAAVAGTDRFVASAVREVE